MTGFITDGSSDYSNDQWCIWVISSPGSAISISFSDFSLESCCDYVFINSCCDVNTTSCGCPTELARLGGQSVSSSMSWTSTTGYMWIYFATDGSVVYPGFEGYWQVAGSCVPCEAGTYKEAAGDAACSSCPSGTPPTPPPSLPFLATTVRRYVLGGCRCPFFVFDLSDACL